jgi:hypothetical protein
MLIDRINVVFPPGNLLPNDFIKIKTSSYDFPAHGGHQGTLLQPNYKGVPNSGGADIRIKLRMLPTLCCAHGVVATPALTPVFTFMMASPSFSLRPVLPSDLWNCPSQAIAGTEGQPMSSESTPWEVKALLYIGLYGFADP